MQHLRTSEIRAVVFDFDGVIRRFDAQFTPDLERRYGLPEDSIQGAAFAEPLITELTTGRIPRREWIRRIGAQIGTPEAAAEWAHPPTAADQELLMLADELRAQGLITAVLTNGTDEVREEAAQLGALEHFDAFFNSAEIGWIKPDPRVFQYVMDQLGLRGSEIFFTDDSPNKLTGARQVGMHAHHYSSVTALRAALREVSRAG
ncbi:HAD family hydrolase [Nesterenkonia ebinurensis]|uniref:HAD family hydrolase n=1 Tax=Nesterenkonia ebinurensis TaxID=2608252 RepID=UPI00123CCAFE|nr:HAD family phosphatase [Nesterenkonia ebinurensis]